METATAQRKSTRALSEKVQAAADARLTRAPLIVKGISPGKLVMIEPRQFERIDVDPAYQRGETKMVGDIVRALQGGGNVLDPVTLCRRPWNGEANKLWIVDGHQRVCAFQQLKRPFQAMIHDSESLEAEKLLFQALNNRRNLSGDLIVKSWTGPSGHLIAAANCDQQHPLHGRVHFHQGSNPYRIGATILARGALAAAVGIKSGTGGALQVLQRLDHSLGKRDERARAEHFLRLAGYVFPKSSIPYVVGVALGHVAYTHWTREIEMPRLPVIEKLRAIKWNEQVPALTKKFSPVIVEMMRKVWK